MDSVIPNEKATVVEYAMNTTGMSEQEIADAHATYQAEDTSTASGGTSHSMRKRLVVNGSIGGRLCGCNAASWCDAHRPAIFAWTKAKDA